MSDEIRKQNGLERDCTEEDAAETAVLERDWNAIAYGLQPASNDPLPVTLRQLHTSLYTLRSYKRWMLKIRETWKLDGG